MAVISIVTSLIFSDSKSFVVFYELQDESGNDIAGTGTVSVQDSAGAVMYSNAVKFMAGQRTGLGIVVPKYPDGTYDVYVSSSGLQILAGQVEVKKGTVVSVLSGLPAPGPTPEPAPAPGPDTGPQLTECVFPTLSLNFIAVMSGLISWLGCIVRNIITLIQWIVDWLLHFPDHLDAWISRLFGIDPALPFFPELMRKIDVYVSARLGVDPDQPILDELVKSILRWFFALIDARADEDSKKRGW